MFEEGPNENRVSSSEARANRRGRDSNPRYGVIPYDGLANRCADELSTDRVSTCDSPKSNDTKNDTKDPDLALVIDAWPELPEAVRAGIMAMVRAVEGR